MAENQEMSETLEFIVHPVPPYNQRMVDERLIPLIEEEIRQKGYGHLLDTSELQITIGQTMPIEPITALVLLLNTPLAKEVTRDVIIPLLRRTFRLEEKPLTSKQKLEKKSEKEG